MTRAMQAEPEPRTVSCAGALGRRGECTVVVRGGPAVLTEPLAEAVPLTGPELSALIDALRAARYELFGIRVVIGRWTVQDGDRSVPVVSTGDGRITVDAPAGLPLVATPATIADARRTLGAAIGNACDEAGAGKRQP